MFSQIYIKVLLFSTVILTTLSTVAFAQVPEARITGDFVVNVYAQTRNADEPDSDEVLTLQLATTFDGIGGGTFQILASSDPTTVGDAGPFTYFADSNGNFTVVFPTDDNQNTAFLSAISPDGQTFSGVSLDDNFRSLIFGIRESTGNTNADLVGEFIYTNYLGIVDHENPILADGIDAHVSVTKIVVDGNGNGTVEILSSSIPSDIGEIGAFTYAVADDGTFTVDSGNTGIGIVSPDSRSFTMINTQPDHQSISVGIKKSTGNTNASISGAYAFDFLLLNIGDETHEAHVSEKLLIIFDGNGNGTFEVRGASTQSEEGATGSFTYSISDDGTFTSNVDGDIITGIASADGQRLTLVNAAERVIGVGIKSARTIKLRVSLTVKLNPIFTSTIQIGETDLELDVVNRISDIELPSDEGLPTIPGIEKSEIRSALESIIGDLGDLRTLLPSAAIDDDDITLLFNIRNINATNTSAVKIDPVTVNGSPEDVYFVLRMQVEKNGEIRDRFDFKPGHPMTLWMPVGTLQDLINNSGFTGVNLQDLAMAFATPTGFTREGIFTEYDGDKSEQITRITHLSDLVGINQNQVGLPPEAKISLGPAVDPDTTFASVFWQTSAATDSKLLFSDSQASVEAGTADSAFTAADSVGVTRHGVRIDGLTKFVKYFFRIHATDPFGRTSFSAIDSFRTLGVPDLQPPIIDILPSVQDLRPDQVTIIWGTDRRATSEVTLDTTAAFTGPTVVSDFDPVQNHSVVASGLLAGKKYWYVASSAAANQKVVGDTLTFTTPNSQDTTAPVITTIPPFVDPGSITATTAQLDWTTNVAANSVVTFWQADSTDTLTVVEPAENTNHSINITGLTAGTKYLYQVRSDRAANNTSVSSITLMFRTRQDAASLRFRRDPALGYIADTFGLLRWRANRPHFGTVYFQVDDGSHTLDLLEGYHKADTDTWIQRI